MFTGVHGFADVQLSERCRISEELVYTQDLIKGIYFYLVWEEMMWSAATCIKALPCYGLRSTTPLLITDRQRMLSPERQLGSSGWRARHRVASFKQACWKTVQRFLYF